MINEVAFWYAQIVLVFPWRSRGREGGREGGMCEGETNNVCIGMRCVHMKTFANRALVESVA